MKARAGACRGIRPACVRSQRAKGDLLQAALVEHGTPHDSLTVRHETQAPQCEIGELRLAVLEGHMLHRRFERFVPVSLQSRNSTRWKLHPVRSVFDRSQFRKVTSVKCDPCNVHAGKRQPAKRHDCTQTCSRSRCGKTMPRKMPPAISSPSVNALPSVYSTGSAAGTGLVICIVKFSKRGTRLPRLQSRTREDYHSKDKHLSRKAASISGIRPPFCAYGK